MSDVLRDGSIVDAEELDSEMISALGDQTRLEILEMLAEKDSYPAAVARELGLSKQQAHYHFKKLKDAGLVTETRTEKRSGGTATFYSPSGDAYMLDLGTGGERVQFSNDTDAKQFLEPLVSEAELDGKIVFGSPDEHGPDQVRARDGHLAAEVAFKLGNYSGSDSATVKLDTEVERENLFDENLLMIGGVLTNTVTKKFNGEFPARFSGESFPYHQLETPESEYSEPEIGVIASTGNPGNPEKSVYMVAGIRNRGTRAAVLAFKDLETVVTGNVTEDFYTVVRGRDIDGDGEIDSYEVVEQSS